MMLLLLLLMMLLIAAAAAAADADNDDGDCQGCPYNTEEPTLTLLLVCMILAAGPIGKKSRIDMSIL